MYRDKAKARMMDLWIGMIARCTKPEHISYPRYGGRGIRVCDRWLNSFADFAADMGPRPPGTSLDRIDNDGSYEPSNCRWATSKEQANSRSTTQLVTIDGITDSLAGWARRRGMTPQTLHTRMRKLGLSAEVALSFPASRFTRHSIDWKSLK